MLGSGKSSGAITEATNELCRNNLNEAIEYMGTKEYQKTRDLDDVIPTHKKPKKEEKREDMAVYDPAAEKAEQRLENQNEEEGSADEGSDDELAFLRKQRAAAIKKTLGKTEEWKAKGHGWYREISQDEFFPTVVREKGGSEDVAVHFYHKDFEKCKVMDAHLSDLAKSTMNIRFVKVDVEKSPFLVEKLKVNVLPCVVLFHNDVATDRLLGFDGLGEDFDNETLLERIQAGLGLLTE